MERLEEYLRLQLEQGFDNFLLQVKLDEHNKLVIECTPLPEFHPPKQEPVCSTT